MEVDKILSVNGKLSKLSSNNSDTWAKQDKLAERQSKMVKKWIAANGWGAIETDQGKFLPCQEYRTNRYALRKIS